MINRPVWLPDLERMWQAIKKYLSNSNGVKASLVDADYVLITDSADTESANGTNIQKLKRITFANLKTAIGSGGGGGDGEVSVLKTGDTANATTTMADSGLEFTAEAGKTYLIEAFLVWDTSATTVGIKASMLASAAFTRFAGHFITDAANGTPDSSSFNANDVVVTTSASPFTAGNFGHMRAILVNGASDNLIKVRFAAETTGTITLKAGSCLRYRKLN